MTIHLVYIAGRYRGTPLEIRANVANAEVMAQVIIQNAPNLLPIVPHSLGWRYGHLRPDDGFWLPATLALMERCHAVYMLPGWERSEGATDERARALEMGLPVFDNPDALFGWARAQEHADALGGEFRTLGDRQQTLGSECSAALADTWDLYMTEKP